MWRLVPGHMKHSRLPMVLGSTVPATARVSPSWLGKAFLPMFQPPGQGRLQGALTSEYTIKRRISHCTKSLSMDMWAVNRQPGVVGVLSTDLIGVLVSDFNFLINRYNSRNSCSLGVGGSYRFCGDGRRLGSTGTRGSVRVLAGPRRTSAFLVVWPSTRRPATSKNYTPTLTILHSAGHGSTPYFIVERSGAGN